MHWLHYLLSLRRFIACRQFLDLFPSKLGAEIFPFLMCYLGVDEATDNSTHSIPQGTAMHFMSQFRNYMLLVKATL